MTIRDLREIFDQLKKSNPNITDDTEVALEGMFDIDTVSHIPVADGEDYLILESSEYMDAQNAMDFFDDMGVNND